MADQSVIHKIVVQMDADPQEFQVPRSAELVSIDQDTRSDGIAVWYRLILYPAELTGSESMVTWRLQITGTGALFPSEARVLGTVVERQFAWHLLDLDGTVRG